MDFKICGAFIALMVMNQSLMAMEALRHKQNLVVQEQQGVEAIKFLRELKALNRTIEDIVLEKQDIKESKSESKQSELENLRKREQELKETRVAKYQGWLAKGNRRFEGEIKKDATKKIDEAHVIRQGREVEEKLGKQLFPEVYK